MISTCTGPIQHLAQAFQHLIDHFTAGYGFLGFHNAPPVPPPLSEKGYPLILSPCNTALMLSIMGC